MVLKFDDYLRASLIYLNPDCPIGDIDLIVDDVINSLELSSLFREKSSTEKGENIKRSIISMLEKRVKITDKYLLVKASKCSGGPIFSVINEFSPEELLDVAEKLTRFANDLIDNKSIKLDDDEDK